MTTRTLLSILLISLISIGIYAQKKVDIANQIHEHDSTINVLCSKIAKLEQKISAIEKTNTDSVAKLSFLIRDLQDSCMKQRKEILELKATNKNFLSSGNQLVKHIEVYENDTICLIVDFQYDEQNRLIKETTTNYTSEQSPQTNSQTYTYSKNMIVSQYSLYIIDNEGFIIEERQPGSDSYSEKYIYKSGKIEEIECFEPYMYTWDNDNINQLYTSSGSLAEVYTYQYTNLKHLNIDVLRYVDFPSTNCPIIKGLVSMYMPNKISYDRLSGETSHSTTDTHISYTVKNNLITQMDLISVRNYENFRNGAKGTEINRKNIRISYYN